MSASVPSQGALARRRTSNSTDKITPTESPIRPFAFLRLRTRWKLAAALLLGFGLGLATPAGAAPKAQTSSASRTARKPAPRRATKPSASTKSSTAERELEELARALHDKPTGEDYRKLSDFANRNNRTALGARAALALGYYDFTRSHFADARKWLARASGDPLLADYALYFQGLTDHATGANDQALEELRRYRLRYPDSVLSDTAVAALAQSALALNRPEEAVAALDAYTKTESKASLVLLRARAQEKMAMLKGEAPIAAATSYLDVVNRFPLSDEAKAASDQIAILQLELGTDFPGAPLEASLARGEALYNAKRWSDVQTLDQILLPQVTGMTHELLELRLAQAAARSSGTPQALADLVLTNADLDAERLYWIAEAQETPGDPTAMLPTVEKLAMQYPQSPWTERALFAAGNGYWYVLDRQHAVEYYQRAVAAFPAGPDAVNCQWRIAWTAYMQRQPDAATRIEQFLRQYPTSSYAVDALYWLGRSYEQAGSAPLARSLYRAAEDRFPQTYFAERAGDRLREIGSSPAEASDLVSVIPPAVPLAPFPQKLPQAALAPWARAQALESIAFDNSAELELRAAYAQTRAPKLLLAIAEAAVAAHHYPSAIAATRQLVPSLEARPFDAVPEEAWRTVYPMPYREEMRREATRNHVDPMLLAGLIRQESAFVPSAISFTNCCLGLMQILPDTGKRMAQHIQVRFSRAQLFNPDYNLRLGTHYLADLLEMFGSTEEAVAAYNAGETHVTAWTTGQHYNEISEFVESIPFNQTREYVQIVLRNAELYRRIYGEEHGPARASERRTTAEAISEPKP